MTLLARVAPTLGVLLRPVGPNVDGALLRPFGEDRAGPLVCAALTVGTSRNGKLPRNPSPPN
ncbi:hypothetical protein MTP03_10870 [Tsukamurella sp. PLM1]|nr:hypothetical protein MTP03_10870 [Tsukamurella sp. PLM1]